MVTKVQYYLVNSKIENNFIDLLLKSQLTNNQDIIGL